MTESPTRHANTIIFPASLDPDAVSVVKRLVDSGFESYLVGGCVRDLLCGHIPKDFDVSTAARPRQIRSRFRNCRVIGRRFKLAHVHFGDKIIEVATFRAPQDADDTEGDDDENLLITRDNVYGNAQEDSIRRDFTINALLYDVNSEEVIDYCGGVEDLNNRVLRTIGDPVIRLAEDPVRMLRAIKFSSRLGLTFDAELEACFGDSAPLIEQSAPPRVLEEIYKLLACGQAVRSLPALVEYGLLPHLLPEVSSYWDDHREQLTAYGRALDLLDHGSRRLPNSFLLTALFLEPWLAAIEVEQGDPMDIATSLLTPAALRMSIPRRDVATVKQTLLLYRRLAQNRRPRRMRLADFLARPSTRTAIDLLYLASLAGSMDPEMHAGWARRLAETEGAQPPRQRADAADDESGESEKRPRRRRRRRGGRSRSRGQREGASADTTTDPATSTQASSNAEDATPTESRPSRSHRVESTSTPPKPVAEPTVGTHSAARSAAASAADADGAAESGWLGRTARFFQKLVGRTPEATADEGPSAGASHGTAEVSDTADADPTTAPNAETETEATPSRRRRRRRGSRGSRGRDQRDRSADGNANEATDATDAEASDKESDGSPSGSKSGSSSRRRRRRSRSRKGGGGSSDRQDGKRQRRGSSQRSGGKSSGGNQRRKSTRKSSDKGPEEATSTKGEESKVKDDSPGALAHQHPEDIEDMFDW